MCQKYYGYNGDGIFIQYELKIEKCFSRKIREKAIYKIDDRSGSLLAVNHLESAVVCL
jgi:hypothetical protein